VESLKDPGFPNARERGNSGLWNFWSFQRQVERQERVGDEGKHNNLNSDLLAMKYK